jgi:DNA-binding GntR family transcriptional regulator
VVLNRAVDLTGKASDRAYRDLRQMIVSMKIEPGTMVDEKTLSAELGIGRTPVREALLKLADQKLVDILPRKGTYVTPIRNTDVRAVEELRWHLESLAARWAAERATPDETLAIRKLLDDAERGAFVDVPDWDVELDRTFHLMLAEATHNPFLVEQLARLYDHSVRLLYANRQSMAAAVEEFPDYRAIHAAIATRDGLAAERGMQLHLRASREQVANGFESSLIGALAN